ncbi:hypothetical protein [Actinomadura rudentiformis]|uniref:Uncharacterized protein n=1 Tax=Actinomadura rudentiformis TaxID=359158 RepID=A0A6H9YWU7_9ACTN|nr:hypothetical protein [Actinomadura rudentiformis]KAB2346922.1 hypothetical protein F8566_22275 [Actinomadura rudentiformis]
MKPFASAPSLKAQLLLAAGNSLTVAAGCVVAIFLVKRYALGDCEGLGCLGTLVTTGLMVLVAGVSLLGLLLYVTGVRPTCVITPLGAVFTMVVLYAWQNMSLPWPDWALVFAAGLGYAAATLAASADAHVAARLTAAGTVLALPLVSGPIHTHQSRESAKHILADARVPLLGPDLPRYGIDYAAANPSGDRFYYALKPRSAPERLTPEDRERLEIRVTVAAVNPTFAPPRHCNAPGWSSEPRDPPCPQVAPQTWRWKRDDSTAYLVRRGSHLAVIEARQGPAAEPVLRQIARTLSPRPPTFFVPIK